MIKLTTIYGPIWVNPQRILSILTVPTDAPTAGAFVDVLESPEQVLTLIKAAKWRIA